MLASSSSRRRSSVPGGDFELVHAVDGFAVYTPPAMAQPQELHFDVDRRHRIQAYWNNQAWVG